MVGGAAVLGHLERAASRAPVASSSRARGRAGPSRRSRTARRRASVSAAGIVCSGWSEKVGQPRGRGGASASSGVAPLTWPTQCGVGGGVGDPFAGVAAIAASGTQSSTAARRRGSRRARASSRPTSVDLDPGGARRAGDRAARAAAARSRQAPGRGRRVERGVRGGGEIPFQFPHRRYQTACRCLWSMGLAPCPRPRCGSRPDELCPIAGAGNTGRSASGTVPGATIGVPMPIYEFECEDCGARFEDLVAAGHRRRSHARSAERSAPRGCSRRPGRTHAAWSRAGVRPSRQERAERRASSRRARRASGGAAQGARAQAAGRRPGGAA